MGVYPTLFGPRIKADPPPKIQTILPAQASQKILGGVLPVLNVVKLILAQGETCHFVDSSVLVTETIVRQSIHQGDSFHIWEGFTTHTGSTVSTPVSMPKYTKGYLYITDKRIVFTASQNAFEQKLSKLTSINMYSDAISLQFGNKTYNLFLPDSFLAKSTLDLLI